MEKFIITEEERSRIIGMHESASSRHYLNEQPKNVSKKGSIKDIANKNFKDKKDFNQVYKMTQDPNTTWVIISSTGNVKVAGISKDLSGKQLKSSDFIDLTNGGEITLKPKNHEINAIMYIQLGRNGSIESGMSWD